MFGFLLVLALIPIVEVMVLIRLGQAIGFWQTVLLLSGMGLLGSFLMRLEGLRVLLDIQRSLDRGEMPGERVIDGFLILIGGVFLVIPGFLSDIAALVLLIPYTRLLLRSWIKARIERAMTTSRRRGGAFQYRFLIDEN